MDYFGGSSSSTSKKEDDALLSYAERAKLNASGALNSLGEQTQSLLGLNEPTPMEQFEAAACGCCPTLTYTQRLTGYCVCAFLGFCLEVGAASRLGDALSGDAAPFALFYTLGNLLGICASFFLAGPYNQMKKMCDDTRYIATSIYFFFMALTLFFAFFQGLDPGARIALILLSIVAQYCAYVWYSLSYIPYAREYALSLCKYCCCGNCESPCGSDSSEA